MTTPSDVSSSPQGRLQQTFDERAAEMGLTLEEDAAPERRAIGIAVISMSVAPAVECRCPERPPEIGPGDDDEIERVVKAWDRASADEFVDTWKRYGCDPVMVVGSDWIGAVTEKDLRRTLASDEARKSLEEFPFYTPRKMKFDSLRIVYQGLNKAFVTFSAEEEYKNGQVFAGTSAMILMKNDDGEWKVALFAKHNRHHDFLAKGGGARS